MLEAQTVAIFIVAGLVCAAILSSLLSFRIGSPLLLVFLVVGLAAGEDGFGLVVFNDAGTAYLIGSIALSVILFDSGYATRFRSYRAAGVPAVVLATAGVLLTAGLTGTAAKFLFNVGWLEGMLLGTILASTDAAAVFFLLRVGGVTIRERIRSLLEIESGTNDPMAIFLTLTLVELIAAGAGIETLSAGLLGRFAWAMLGGALIGAAGGWLILVAVNRIQFDKPLYPLIVLSLAVTVFAMASIVEASGFLATYIAGLIAGNMRMRYSQALEDFQSGVTWFCQIAMFLTLGLLATPSEFPAVFAGALAIAAFLIFFARPLAVWICLSLFRFSPADMTFVSWVGLRGAVSILLGIIPLVGGIGDGQSYFNIAFIVVLLSLAIQGWSIGPVARWLGLLVPPIKGPVDRIQLELPTASRHELVTYKIAPDSPVALGARMPRWARPSLVIRDGASMSARRAGRLKEGDSIYIFVTPRQVQLLDKLFARPVPEDEFTSTFFGDFILKPDARMGDVAPLYDFSVSEEEAELSAEEFLLRRLPQPLDMGDRTTIGTVDLIVRALNEEGTRVLEVGISVQPMRPSLETMPLPLPASVRKVLLKAIGSMRSGMREE
ncbi:sodium/hydrogen antiporter [Tepidicaulis marinus]|uniref:Sodium/hydrogen antiporter n=1 Tax=Tepidicaulis marinus TaxID=1333998 RepID=A0A081BFI7_9HYPH|nr:potassium/proton antiporter [Tepidicaulis marinus]GAK46805.1 sodium/hydrogen antiporter [Tepidicaulis marinus]